MQKSVGTSD
uniref:Uncharacterized protein n=1 Tax=Rhizophora mucronata TaxID=61149 RepID=A0A2P2QIL7_RHIMU